MAPESSRLRWKTWACSAVVVCSNVSGNFLLKRGMPPELSSAADYITVLFRPMVSLGVLLLILWLASRMAMLSWADLSYVLPVTSLQYVLVVIAGRVLLDERVSVYRWIGIASITAGVALVSGATVPQTARPLSKAPGARR